MRLKNKVAIVTGGGGGIGEGIVNCLAKEGASIAVFDMNLENAVRAASAAERKYKRSIIALHADVTVNESVSSMVDAVIKAFGKIDILVNNVGISGSIGLP